MNSGLSILSLFAASPICFAIGAVGSLLTARSKRAARIVGCTMAMIGAACALAVGLLGLTGATFQINLPQLLPVVPGGIAFGLDRLSAFFVVIVAVGAIPASLYALGYTREHERDHSLAGMGAALNLFIAAMLLVPLARNVLTFLLLWEGMSLASYFLVMTEHERQETRKAGWLYFVMTHAGFVCLLAGFLVVAHLTGSMSFADWHSLAASPGVARNLAFVFFLVGFGSKAGLIPLHIWLPQAHPAAPSHVSALMSGVMLKLGVYGLVRVAFDWLGAGPAWWGSTLLVLAAISAVLGVLYAIIDPDLKRVLAYSSVENIGIILLGLAAAMLFQTYQLPGLAAVALIAALYHCLNHAAFKSLLFLGAGAILQATHTTNLEKLGGLIKRMPQTAVYFLIASVSIAALPPANGFISEWLTFQALLLSFHISGSAINLVFVFAIAALALTSGLAAACFTRAFGITFLALPRSEAAERAREAGFTMRAAMGSLAVVCIALGVLPFPILSLLNETASALTGASAELHFGWSAIVANGNFATVSPMWIGGALLIALAAIPLGLRIARANTSRRYFETWGCGRAVQTARFEYTATAFANPFKRVFQFLYRPKEDLDIQFHPESRFFVRTITYKNQASSVIDDAIYAPLGRFVGQLAARARLLQSGNVHVYLAYILVALVALLILAR
jgi:hydrogenase-4 component B